ncbi:MAG TPA: GH25 family lysozyme [Polyangia bacterium]
MYAIALLVAGCGGGHAGAGGVAVADDALGTCAAGPVVNGIDVSHYDGTIDWAMVKASGIDFAFMKATENTTFVDPDFAANWKAAGAAGVIRGAYHFFRPEVDAVAQADFFVATAGVPARGDLPLALDLEVTDMVAGATVAADARTFLARVQQKTGRVPIVYTSARVWTDLLGSPAATGFADVALWDANWTTSCPTIPPAWATWTFWQNSATGTVPGISGMANVDLDQFNGSLAALQGYVAPAVDGGTDDGGADDGGATNDAGAGADTGPPPGAKHGGCAMAGASATGGGWIFCSIVVLAATRKRAMTSA